MAARDQKVPTLKVLRACYHQTPSQLKRLAPESPAEIANMGDSQLYADAFTLTDINDQKYDRVSRLKGNNENGDTEFTLDVNTELYPCSIGERLSLAIASSLSLDGTKDDSKGWRGVGRGEQTLADEYDYVCHGKVYRFEEGDDENMYAIVAASAPVTLLTFCARIARCMSRLEGCYSTCKAPTAN